MIAIFAAMGYLDRRWWLAIGGILSSTYAQKGPSG